tara:strand:- start:854 stop:1405 length:552 start_codon:yes stop_codon:yes gene_type:complete
MEMKQKKLVGIFIVFIMTFSILGFIGGSFFTEDENIKKYKNHIFYRDSQGWRFQVGNEIYYFQYLPEQLTNYSMNFPTYNLFSEGKLYFGYEPGVNLNTDLAMSKLGTFFYNRNLVVVRACIKEKGCPDIPIIDCATKTSLVFQKTNNTIIESINKCLVLNAKDEVELTKVTERLLYNLLGIL